MGFCLHNNAAVAALAAQKAGAKKVLIVDWDVHHGNGTQEIFEGNKSVLYISLHRHEDGSFYPGTGAADEVGVLDGKGFSVNIPWSCGGVGDNDYIFAFQHVVLPIATEFAPDITIISAGFDAARGDPLGCCDVTPAGYSQMTSMLTACSEENCWLYLREDTIFGLYPHLQLKLSRSYSGTVQVMAQMQQHHQRRACRLSYKFWTFSKNIGQT
eukprot:UN02142